MAAEPKHRDAIVSAAAELFQRHGFSATGMNQIVERSGAPKGSLYHYFPEGKDAIGEAAIKRSGDTITVALRTIAAGSPTVGGFLSAYAGHFGAAFERSGFTRGCPLATVLLEAAPQNEAMPLAGRAALAEHAAVLAGVLQRDGFPAAVAERLGNFAIAAIEGGLLQARVEQALAPLANVFACLATLIEAEKRLSVSREDRPEPA